MKVRVFESVEGIEMRAKTGSFRAWRHLAMKTGTEMKLPEHDGLCPYCDGWRSNRSLEGYGDVWCLCKILERNKILRLKHAPFSSPVKSEYTLDQLQLWGDPRFKKDLTTAINTLTEWLEWPEKWLVIIGSVGVGKTHMLVSLANSLRPWSLYVTTGDLESKVFIGMDKSSQYSLEDLISAVSHAPFLFLDDFGAEHGGDFFMSILRRVIDFRYQRPSEYVTIVASNLNERGIYRDDVRIADRLFDKHIGKVITLASEQSWRRHGNTV